MKYSRNNFQQNKPNKCNGMDMNEENIMDCQSEIRTEQRKGDWTVRK